MKERKITNQELFLLKEHSNLTDQAFKQLYDQYGQASKNQWDTFIYVALLVCGIGFFVSGLLFFFAFNWDDMPANVKFFLIGLGIGVGAYLSISKRVKETVNEISLVATSVLIGVLLAVFGQTYQTGANAYDLFLTWVVVVTPLTVVSQSTYQWLFFSVLANITLVLAMVQRLQIESVFIGILCMLALNSSLLVIPQIKKIHPKFQLGNLYIQLQLVVVFSLATTGFGFWLFTNATRYQAAEVQGAIWTLLLAILIIGGGFAVGWMKKRIYVFSYALIAALSCGLLFWMKLFSDAAEGLLLYMLYAIGAIFLIIKLVSNKSKVWKDEK